MSPWKPFVHPTLGKVEIGGWIPFFRDNPAPEAVASIVSKQLPILSLILSRASNLVFHDIQCKKLADGLFELKVWVVNQGDHPSQTKQNTVNRFARPDLLILEVAKEAILNGQRRHSIQALAAKSGRKQFRWLVKGSSGSAIKLHLSPAHCSPTTKEILLP